MVSKDIGIIFLYFVFYGGRLFGMDSISAEGSSSVIYGTYMQ